MRLIDAEALEEKIENLITRFKALGRKQVAEDYNFVLTVLSTAPTIEAKPIVHAHWKPFIEDVEIYNTGGYREKRQTGWICSKCGKGFTEFGHTKYCSDCGAQMDEEFASDNNVGSKTEGVKIPVISMEDVPKIMEEKE